MSEIRALRTEPLLPHPATLGDDIRPECGHPSDRTCDGCGACTDPACDGGCYCGEAEEDEPLYLLAS